MMLVIAACFYFSKFVVFLWVGRRLAKVSGQGRSPFLIGATRLVIGIASGIAIVRLLPADASTFLDGPLYFVSNFIFDLAVWMGVVLLFYRGLIRTHLWLSPILLGVAASVLLNLPFFYLGFAAFC
jgi:hypothetical protein